MGDDSVVEAALLQGLLLLEKLVLLETVALLLKQVSLLL